MEVESINRSPRMRASTFGMFLIGLTMWVGVPAGWLFVGSRIKASTDSLGLALAVMSIGAIVTVVLLVRALGMLNTTYRDDFEDLNGKQPMRTPLEPVLVVSAGIAVAAFTVWFIFFAGGGGGTLFKG